MAIGDTWETINTYTFVGGETIISADYENDVVNNLQYLYNNQSSSVNIYTANTNTDVNLTASTNDILTGLTLTFTPVQDKVLLFIIYFAGSFWNQSTGGNINVGYKLNSGAITYIAQDSWNTGVLVITLSVTPLSSNTITMYARNTSAGLETMNLVRLVAIEMAN